MSKQNITRDIEIKNKLTVIREEVGENNGGGREKGQETCIKDTWPTDFSTMMKKRENKFFLIFMDCEQLKKQNLSKINLKNEKIKFLIINGCFCLKKALFLIVERHFTE